MGEGDLNRPRISELGTITSILANRAKFLDYKTITKCKQDFGTNIELDMGSLC